MPSTALLSVFDKTGIVELARALHHSEVQLLSTGGTAQLLKAHELPITEVSDHTGFPEMLDGRVKTLHPKIHGGLLARRDLPEHLTAIHHHKIPTIDFLVVNLYPFEKTVARHNCTLEEAIENIDIGGPAMVRSAAKNWHDVVVLTDPSQYDNVLTELRLQGCISMQTKFALAVAAFNRISQYDAAISDYLGKVCITPLTPNLSKGKTNGIRDFGKPDPNEIELCKTPTASFQNERQPHLYDAQINPGFIKVQDLRYGENPHQTAAFYRDLHPASGSIATAQQLQGKELSYNNIADADAAWECVKSFPECACVIVKHANPCGVAIEDTPQASYIKALQTDTTSAFGGIVAFNRLVDGATVLSVLKLFVEVLIAPAFTKEALALLKTKNNLRVLQIKWTHTHFETPMAADARKKDCLQEMKRVGSGLLVQSTDDYQIQKKDLKVVTQKQPSPQQWQDMLFAWKVAKYVKSNAIVYCRDGMTLGIGAGQMSRVDSAQIASTKAQKAGLALTDSAVASDAFFPFSDGIELVANAGASCVIQPGGSIRDEEVIAKANEKGLVMVFTGVRHFRH